MKIANKISLSFLAGTLILSSIAASIFYSIAKDALQKSIYNNLDTAVSSRADHIETYLEMLKASVGQLSKSVVLENLLKVNGKEDSGWRDAFEVAMKRLARTKEINPAIAEFLLLDKTGKVVASSNESNVGLDKSTDSIFLGGQKETYIKDAYYSEVAKEPLMAVSTPFLDSQTGELLGVLVARETLDKLNSIVAERTGMGDTGEIYIVNKYGFMITPSRSKEDVVLKQKVDTENIRIARLHKSREHILSKKKRVDVFPDYRGVQVLGAHEYIPQMQWAVLSEIDAKEALTPLAKLRLIFFLVLFIVPIAAWLLGISLAKLITGPLHKLHKGTEVIGSGNLDYKLSTDAKDEVGQLSRAFDAMAANLKTSTTSIENLNKEITERKQAEEVLRESEGKYRNLTENISELVYRADPKTTIATYVNKAVEDIYGYTVEEWLKDPMLWLNTIHPDDKERVLAESAEAKKKIERVITTYRIIRKNKTVRWVESHTNWEKDQQGNVVSVNGLMYDITERKKMEEAQKQLIAIIEATPDFVGFADAKDKHIIYVNKAGRKMCGIGNDEDVTKLKIYDVHPEWTNKMFVEEILPAAVRDGVWTGECAFLNIRDRHEIPVLMVLSSHKASNGEVEVFSTISRDITERKKAEETLKNSEERFRVIFNNANDGIILMDLEANIFATGNNKICQMLGYSLEEIKRINVPDIHPKEDLPYVLEQFDKQVKREIELAEDLPVKRKDGSVFYCDVNTSLVTLGGRKYLLGIFRDVTERKKAEKERANLFEQIKVLNLELEDKVKERTKEIEKALEVLEEANIQLQEANAHKNKFLSTMSHELRTPLNGIIGFTDLLAGQFYGPLNEKQMSYIAQVESSSKHLLSLIDGLLTIIRIDMGKAKINIEKFNIEESIKAVVDMLDSQLNKKNFKVNIECDPQILEISADKDIFKQISLSLLDNAIKYTPDEGSITIRSSMNPNNIMISVTDTGIGIEPKDQEKLFSEFYQVDRVRDEALGGMGIGLALTKRLVNLLGGEIGVESELGKGSTFWFTLPQNVIPNSFRNLINDGK